MLNSLLWCQQGVSGALNSFLLPIFNSGAISAALQPHVLIPLAPTDTQAVRDGKGGGREAKKETVRKGGEAKQSKAKQSKASKQARSIQAVHI